VTNPSFYLPIVCFIWIVLAVVLVIARPALARRAGERLTAEEGLAAAPQQPAVAASAPAS
jgi:hypothetical protein